MNTINNPKSNSKPNKSNTLKKKITGPYPLHNILEPVKDHAPKMTYAHYKKKTKMTSTYVIALKQRLDNVNQYKFS